MSYLDMITFDGPSGTVAIDPNGATVVWKRGQFSEVQLESGELIALGIDAASVAKALWGFLSEARDGFFNDAHVIAIVPHPIGNRLIMKGNVHLDNEMPVNQMIMSQRNLEITRKRLRAGEQD